MDGSLCIWKFIEERHTAISLAILSFVYLPAGRRVCCCWRPHTFTMSHNVYLFSSSFFRHLFSIAFSLSSAGLISKKNMK
jgi:hypothetical protein